jgi:hypothetical protein
MKLWQKLLITVAAMLIASFAMGRLWLAIFDFVIPSYLAGVMGGLAAIPVWELLRLGNKKPGE